MVAIIIVLPQLGLPERIRFVLSSSATCKNDSGLRTMRLILPRGMQPIRCYGWQMVRSVPIRYVLSVTNVPSFQ